MKKTNVKRHVRRTKKKVVPVKQHKRKVNRGATARSTTSMKWYPCPDCGGRIYTHRPDSHICSKSYAAVPKTCTKCGKSYYGPKYAGSTDMCRECTIKELRKNYGSSKTFWHKGIPVSEKEMMKMIKSGAAIEEDFTTPYTPERDSFGFEVDPYGLREEEEEYAEQARRERKAIEDEYDEEPISISGKEMAKRVSKKLGRKVTEEEVKEFGPETDEDDELVGVPISKLWSTISRNEKREKLNDAMEEVLEELEEEKKSRGAWVNFKHKGKTLTQISDDGLFPGEIKSTKELISYRTKIPEDEIKVDMSKRKLKNITEAEAASLFKPGGTLFLDENKKDRNWRLIEGFER